VGPPDTLPPEVNEALVLDHLSKHYREWLDEAIPALDDHTRARRSRISGCAKNS
jgi:hypothetical protein